MKATLTDTDSYLLSRLGDAWVELGRGRIDLVREELAAAMKTADKIVDEAAALRAAIREWAYRMDETMPPRWWEEEPLTDRMAAERNLRRLAGLANDKEQA